jgi:hypothetical protein
VKKTETMIILQFPTQETRAMKFTVADAKYCIDGVPAVLRDGQVYFSFQDWERAEYMIANDLVARKVVSGEAFKFMRKTLGLGLKSLAKSLYHPKTFPDPEQSIKNWESGVTPVDVAVWERLGIALKKGPRHPDPELTNAEAMTEANGED